MKTLDAAVSVTVDKAQPDHADQDESQEHQPSRTQGFIEIDGTYGDDAHAAPRERLTAFIHALVDRVEEQQELLLFAEMSAPGARFAGSYGLYRQHLAMLLSQLSPGTDHEFLADALLAPLNADLFVWQRQSGISVARIKAGLDLVITGVAG